MITQGLADWETKNKESDSTDEELNAISDVSLSDFHNSNVSCDLGASSIWKTGQNNKHSFNDLDNCINENFSSSGRPCRAVGHSYKRQNQTKKMQHEINSNDELEEENVNEEINLNSPVLSHNAGGPTAIDVQDIGQLGFTVNRHCETKLSMGGTFGGWERPL